MFLLEDIISNLCIHLKISFEHFLCSDTIIDVVGVK